MVIVGSDRMLTFGMETLPIIMVGMWAKTRAKGKFISGTFRLAIYHGPQVILFILGVLDIPCMFGFLRPRITITMLVNIRA
jgi:hypothetical protein